MTEVSLCGGLSVLGKLLIMASWSILSFFSSEMTFNVLPIWHALSTSCSSVSGFYHIRYPLLNYENVHDVNGHWDLSFTFLVGAVCLAANVMTLLNCIQNIQVMGFLEWISCFVLCTNIYDDEFIQTQIKFYLLNYSFDDQLFNKCLQHRGLPQQLRSLCSPGNAWNILWTLMQPCLMPHGSC